ncbi:MAG: hypothetical protein ACYS0I_17760, partial [Planctomycetota bacterium]
MEKAEIKAIEYYLAGLEESLTGVKNRGKPTPGHLTELEQVIKTLNGEKFRTRDYDLKLFLVTLEMKAMRCKA